MNILINQINVFFCSSNITNKYLICVLNSLFYFYCSAVLKVDKCLM